MTYDKLHVTSDMSVTACYPELYGNQWEDIAVCGGLVSTATTILLVIFIPKVGEGRHSSRLYQWVMNWTCPGVPDDSVGVREGGECTAPPHSMQIPPGECTAAPHSHLHTPHRHHQLHGGTGNCKVVSHCMLASWQISLFLAF